MTLNYWVHTLLKLSTDWFMKRYTKKKLQANCKGEQFYIEKDNSFIWKDIFGTWFFAFRVQGIMEMHYKAKEETFIPTGYTGMKH